MQTIEKRLGSRRRGEGGEIEDDESETANECPEARRKTGLIIKTKDSLGLGAVFLQSPGNLNDPDECVRLCCEDKNCNTAVTKKKQGEVACYLFDCGRPNICLFSPNTDFVVTQFPSRGSSKKSEQGSDEQRDHADDLAGLVTAEPTTPLPTTIIKATVAAYPPGQLFSECSTGETPCSSPNSECSKGFCVCAKGYHAFGDHCKKDCREYEFECTRIDEPCIAIYDQCDGSVHCKDGTDELDCPAIKHYVPRPPDNKPPNSPPSQQESSPHDEKKPVPTQSSSAKTSHGSSSSKHTHHEAEEPQAVPVGQWSIAAHRGAVIALTLGIILTAGLLVFVLCRMKNVRRRSRKGRAMGNNDADYLINGMYL